MSKKTKSKEVKLEDKSEFVFQGERLPISLNIRDFPWTDKQKKFIETALSKDTNYIICKAPAGVGKTLMSIYVGLRLLNEGKIKNIYFCRQPVESSNFSLGFLSGDFDSKMEPYIMPMMDHLHELLPPSQINKLLEGGFIQSIPIGFLKGRTFHSSLIIADESEDFFDTDFRLVLGRIGKYSKLILIGDNKQSNIRTEVFSKIYDLFNDEESIKNGIFCMSFDSSDIMRNKILAFVLDKLSKITK